MPRLPQTPTRHPDMHPCGTPTTWSESGSESGSYYWTWKPLKASGDALGPGLRPWCLTRTTRQATGGDATGTSSQAVADVRVVDSSLTYQ